MKKAIRTYYNVLTYIAVAGLVGFLACVALQVFARVFLPKSPNWTEEAARFLFIFMVGFAGNTAVGKDEYVGVELLTERFPDGVYTDVIGLCKVATLEGEDGIIDQDYSLNAGRYVGVVIEDDGMKFYDVYFISLVKINKLYY